MSLSLFWSSSKVIEFSWIHGPGHEFNKLDHNNQVIIFFFLILLFLTNIFF